MSKYFKFQNFLIMLVMGFSAFLFSECSAASLTTTGRYLAPIARRLVVMPHTVEYSPIMVIRRPIIKSMSTSVTPVTVSPDLDILRTEAERIKNNCLTEIKALDDTLFSIGQEMVEGASKMMKVDPSYIKFSPLLRVVSDCHTRWFGRLGERADISNHRAVAAINDFMIKFAPVAELI